MKKIFSFVAVALMSVSMFAANLTVAEAVEAGKKLADNTDGTETVSVEGYVAKLFNQFKDGKQSFYMSDDANADPEAKNYEFEAYNCTLEKAVAPHAKVVVTGKLTNYVSSKGIRTIEIKEGTVEILEDAPVVEAEEVTIEEALEIGAALEDKKSTSKEYKITGYISMLTDGYGNENEDGGWEQYGTLSFWLAPEDNKEAASAEEAFFVYAAKAAELLPIGSKVAVTCTIKHFGDMVENGTKNPQIEVIELAGLENIVLTEKAQKVMVDGAVYVIRNNKLYNLQGTQLR